jgi:ribonuclease BN (tRNA processing enzyme)
VPWPGKQGRERMKLTILGGSAAGPNPGQGCSGYLVESGMTRIVVDLGSGTFPELRRHIDYRLLDGVVLSHGHLDHFLDVLTLRYALAYNPIPADRRLPLWLPPGGFPLLDRLAQAITDDSETGEFLSVFEVNQYEPDAMLIIGELNIRFFPTVHYVPCWALRISNDVDGDLFYTADSGPAANLGYVAKGSHVVVAEGTDRGTSQEPYASRGHMTPAEAGALARDAGAVVLVLSHLWVEDNPFQAVREASRMFARPVELATPGLCITWQAD